MWKQSEKQLLLPIPSLSRYYRNGQGNNSFHRTVHVRHHSTWQGNNSLHWTVHMPDITGTNFETATESSTCQMFQKQGDIPFHRAVHMPYIIETDRETTFTDRLHTRHYGTTPSSKQSEPSYRRRRPEQHSQSLLLHLFTFYISSKVLKPFAASSFIEGVYHFQYWARQSNAVELNS